MIRPPHYKHRTKSSYKESQPWANEVLKRDNYICRDCNNNKRLNLVVHHIDESRKLGTKKMNNNPNNLVTLCKQCHAIRHKITIRFVNPNLSLIIELKNQGKTYKEIGNYLGLSRQRIHQIKKRISLI